MIHHGHPGRHALADDSTRGQRSVAVEHFNPVVIDDIQLFRVHFAHPDNRTTASQRQHQQVVAVRGVNAPLLVWRQEVQRFFRITVGFRAHDCGYRTGVNRRTVNQQAFTKVAHPLMILIQRLTARQGTPWDQLMNVGITGVIGHMLIFQA
ncbi:hypothetical protein D3C78_1261360 [compost metagenome]